MSDFKAIHPNQLYERFMQFDYISFDIFDTLIKRELQKPEDVFYMAGYFYYDHDRNAAERFYYARKEAETVAREKTAAKEITIDDIYHVLPYSEDEKQALKEMEILAEQTVCVPNRAILDVFNRLLSDGKRLYLISDMYLPRAIIELLLNKCGIGGYSALYLSSEQLCRKKNGLYDLFMRKEHIQPKKWLHIGDNFYSDIWNAANAGANVHWIKNPNTRKTNVKKEGKSFSNGSQIDQFIHNHLDASRGCFFQTGYKVYGPLLYGFTRWVGNEVSAQKVSKILFFARDAYIVQKAFEILYGHETEMIYFFLSRQSDFGTRLQGDYSLENILNVVHKRKNETIASLLRRLHADTKENLQRAEEKSLDLSQPLSAVFASDGSESKERKYLIDVCKEMETQYIYENECFIQYVKQNVRAGDRIAVIDVGWNGTEQKAVEIALQESKMDVPVFGYYIGMNLIRLGREKNLHMKGYLSDEESTARERVQVKAMMGLLEFFLTAPHGTTLGYREENGKMIPRLKEYEYQNADGTLLPETKIIRELQEGALEFIREYHQSGLEPLVEWNKSMAAEALRRLSMKPTMDELTRFGDASFYESKRVPLAKPKGITKYVKDLQGLKRDFSESTWKLGFLRRLFHNVPLPYQTLYAQMLKAGKLI